MNCRDISRLLLAVGAVFLSCFDISAQQTVRFPLLTQAETVEGDLYGSGTRGVVLAHGGRFGKESWKKQADALASSGFRVLAIAFRGDRPNPDGSPGSFGSSADNAEDVMAAIAYLHRQGVKEVSAVGASFGGDAVGEACARSHPGDIARLVILASTGGAHPEQLTAPKLFIVATDDRSGFGLRLPDISEHYARAPQPKQLVVLEGSAHAQFLFATDQGPRLFREIESFLRGK